MNVALMVQSFFAHLSADTIIIAVIFVAALIDALRNGYARTAALGLSLPTAMLLYGFLPQAAFIGPAIASLSAPVAQAGIFLALCAVTFILISRIVGFGSGAFPTPFYSIIAAAAVTILVLSTWIHVPSMQNIWHFGPAIQSLFGVGYAPWWIIAASVALAIVMS